MKISLLYKDINNKAPLMPGAEQTVYDLSLDRLTASLCQGEGNAEAVLSMLRAPLTNGADILYRQQILRDFDADRELLRSLSTLLTRYDKIKSDWVELRSGISHIGTAGADARLECACASLKVTAVFPRALSSFFSGVAEILSRDGIKSEGLVALRELCSDLVSDSSLGEIVDISDSFRYGEPSERSYEASITVTPELSVKECGIISSTVTESQRYRDNEQKKYARRLKELETLRSQKQILDSKSGAISRLLGTLLSDRSQDKNRTLPLPGSARENISDLLAAATEEIDSTLSAVTDSVYSMLHGIGAELRFYEGALSLMDSIRSGGLTLTYPEISEGECEYASLKDAYLLCEGKSGSDIIPNDFILNGDIDGMIVRGGNGTGKTVFLRSVGTAQLFAQAGLPVCADRARVAPRSGVFTHFSSAEEDFSVGDTAGRFEGEVRAVASIVDRLTPGALLLLNETFQTTAYAEGADAMAGILSVLPRLGTKYIFVTHLGTIGELADSSRVLMMKTQIISADGKTDGERYVLTSM